MKIGGINVPIITTFDPKGLSAAEQRLAKFGQAANVALAGVAAVIGKSTLDAANFAETVSKSNVVFGEAAASVQKYAESTAQIGLSKAAALDAATTFAVFGKSAGLAGTDLAKFSTDFTTLAVDMASFSNTTPAEAIEAIGAALRGESEPIRKYGVLLDDATLRNEALKLGLIETTKQALTPQQKVLAAQSAILNQTKDAQGDAIRTQDSAVNSGKRLQAQIDNISVTMGQAFLPILENILPLLLQMATYAADNTTALTVLIGVIGAIAVVVKATQAAMVLYNAVNLIMEANAKRAAAGQWALNTALLANPFVLITVAIIAVVAAIAYLWNNNEAFRNAVIAAWEAIKSAASTVWNAIVNALKAAWDWITKTAATVWGGITKFFSTVWENIKNGAVTAWEAIVTFFKNAPENIKNAFIAAAQLFLNIGKNIVEGIKNGVANAWSAFVNFVSDKVGGIIDAVKKKFGIQSPSKVFRGIGENLVQGLALGMDGMDGVVNKKLSDVRAAATLGNVAFSTNGTAANVAGAGAINITVNGAIDSESTARQIYDILQQSAARTGNYTGLGLAPLSI